MIKRIELINFMSHEHSVFELSEGLNVLVGPNNCGKSAVVAALQILCYNESSKYALRHESKLCSILVETSDGHTVRWSRKKSGSPWYEIDGQRYDRLGKQGVPEQLHQVLRLPRVASDKDRFDVHFGEQSSPVFLLNEKPRQAADFFASSSDARHLLEMQVRHKSNIRDANTRRNQLHLESVQLTSSLKTLEPLNQLREQLKSAEQNRRKLDEDEQAMLHLQNMIKGLRHSATKVNQLQKRLALLDTLPNPPDFPDENWLKDLIDRLRSLCLESNYWRERLQCVSQLAEPPKLHPTEQIATAIQQLKSRKCETERLSRRQRIIDNIPDVPVEAPTDQLENLMQLLKRQLEADRQLNRKAADLQKTIDAAQAELEHWVREHPNCPTCSQPIDVGQFLNAKGGLSDES